MNLLAGIGFLKSFVNGSSRHSTESFFSQLKEELLRYIRIRNFQEAVLVVDDYFHFYNHDRIQLKTKLTSEFNRRQFV